MSPAVRHDRPTALPPVVPLVREGAGDQMAIAWAAGRTDDVLALAGAMAARHAASPRQRRLLATALVGLRAQATGELGDAGLFPAIHLPLLVHAAVTGDDAPALPLAAATALLWRGIDLCDDLADGDALAGWEGWRPGEIALAATTLLAALPQRVLAGLTAPAASRAAMAETLAVGLLRASAGQGDDLAVAGDPAPDPVAVEASVVGKSGEQFATYAEMAALLAGAPPPRVAAFGALARAVGAGGQLLSDCHDLFTLSWSRDLANGTRTLPIALHLSRQGGPAREQFLTLLDAAREDGAAQAEVRRRLRAAGEVRRCAFIVETYRVRARRALAEAAPFAPAADRLQELVDSVSFFAKGDRT